MIVDLAMPRIKVGQRRQEIFLATPADWTLAAECIGMHDVFDEPNARTFDKIVKPICDGCQVRDLCLESALEEEGDLPAVFRAGVRGGLRPPERSRLALERVGMPEIPETCAARGHAMRVEGGAYWNDSRRTWVCSACHRQNKADRKAGGEGGFAEVPCPDCGSVLMRASLRRHRRESCPAMKEKVA